MDFYKKIVKTKDAASVLIEKEYKCASLQAITSEAIKENNKKTLKELVEEINGHLADLRAIKDLKETRSKEKCANLIKKFEDCLVKIVGNNLLDVLAPINGQLQELQNQTEIAVKDKNVEELVKLAERIERNIEVVIEIPEVKNGDKKIMEVVNKYTSLLNEVLHHIYMQRRSRISSPILLESTHQKISDEYLSVEQEIPSSTPLKKIALNEVEEKLKLMRQKRLNRLSTFVDQQTKLAEERSKDNSPITPNKSSDDLSVISEKVEVSTAKTMNKAAAQEKKEKNYVNIETKSGFVGASRNNFGKGEMVRGSAPTEKRSIASSSSKIQEKPLPQTKLQNKNNPLNVDEKKLKTSSSSENEPISQANLPKGDLTRSFAERQIENARIQNERPKVQLKSSNSTKTTPPRTPTQIRKIFNSFNACVLGANSTKSIEDLSSESKSPFEQELKNVQLRNTGLSNLLEGFSEKNSQNFDISNSKSNSFKEEQKITKEKELPPPLPPKSKKPVALNRKTVITKYEEEKLVEQKKINAIGNSASQSQIHLRPNDSKDSNNTSNQENSKTKSWRSSLDNDSVMVRHHEPSDCTITIKRDSNTLEPPIERYSFSTFRSSTDSVKEDFSVDNPLYEIVDRKPNTKLGRQNSISIDTMLLSAKAKELRDVDFNTFDSDFGSTWKRTSKQSYRKELFSDANRFIALEPVITKLEYIIQVFMGLKRDEDYSFIDRLLSKYYVKVDEVPATTAFDKIEKSNLLERLTQASRDLENRVIKNESMLEIILKEQVEVIGRKFGIA